MLFGIAGGLSIREAYHKFQHAIVTAEINLQDDLLTDQIETIIDQIAGEICKVLPMAQCFIEVEQESEGTS